MNLPGKFPDGFVWGSATASYQIEGAVTEEGRGLSVWDMMCRQPGKVALDQSGVIACDHYYLAAADVDLMATLGYPAYRFSIAWPRVLPEGTGVFNAQGLGFYDRLVDHLLAKGIQPWVTLFHWDYPYALFCQGGWLNRDSAAWFADYAAVVVERLSDRVQHWITLNEPQCFIAFGHQTGYHAPGLKLGLAEVLLAAHHTLLAHGRAVQVIRELAQESPTIGVAPVGIVRIPDTNAPEDIAAARASTFTISDRNFWNNTWFADPMILGHYPEDGLKLFAEHLPKIHPDDMAAIAQPLDFYGVNIYDGARVRAGQRGGVEWVSPPDGEPRTMMDWPVAPEALYWGPKFLYERYQLPLMVTENGMANCDWVDLDGQVHDPQRIDFLKRYLRAYGQAIADGIDGRGYFAWSFMDNFEWALGYQRRFGLVHVDYASQKRTPKDSARWYQQVIASNGALVFA